MAVPGPDGGARRDPSLIAATAAGLSALCAIVPYALVAVGLRLLMARVFFLAGQGRIEGPNVPIALFGWDTGFHVVLPAQINESTFLLFEKDFAVLPIPSAVTAYFFTYAEFVLPICLVLGFATRLSALVLLVMTILLQVYVAPQALWTAHAYWIAILLVLMSVGPGAISVDRLLRHVHDR
jgi:putative oxidoreductase